MWVAPVTDDWAPASTRPGRANGRELASSPASLQEFLIYIKLIEMRQSAPPEGRHRRPVPGSAGGRSADQI